VTVDVVSRHSPLESYADALAAAGGPAVTLREVPFLSQIDLRLDPVEHVALAKIGNVLGVSLPLATGTVTSDRDRSALWLGPDWWLVVDGPSAGPHLEAGLRIALAGVHHSVVDVSANRTVLEVRGPLARNVLMKGCALDLHPRAFAAGRCAQTALARAQVILQQVSDAPAYRIFVRGSFAPYLAEWLMDAMVEYQ
jgi:sarcosine oxidase subunit gamma